MSNSKNVREHLINIPGAVKTDDGVVMEKEGFSISAELSNSNCVEDIYVVMVSFTIDHPDLLTEAVNDFSASTGRTEDEAVEDAVRVWVEGALPVFLHLYKKDNCGLVEELELTSLSEEGEPVVWDMLRGPLQGIGESTTEELKGSFEESMMLHTMLNDITGQLHRNELLWIRAVITKNGDEISGDCYINNEFWEDGLRALYYWADSWGPCESPQIRRQFFICSSTDKEADPQRVTQLKEQLAEQMKKSKKKWWKPWKK